jgi:thioredoxin reductase (NADPH)
VQILWNIPSFFNCPLYFSFKRSDIVDSYDLIIIGAGAAGMSAGIYGTRSGLKTLLIDGKVAGGLVNDAPLIENYLGFPSVKGGELVMGMKAHMLEYAKLQEFELVESLEQAEEGFKVKTQKGEYTADALILATGTTHKFLNVKGEQEYMGKGISLCATCDGFFFKDKKVGVIGGGNSGAIAAIYLADICERVTVLEYMPHWMCEASYQKKIQELGIDYRMNAEVIEFVGADMVAGVKYKDRKSGEEQVLEVDGAFLYVGLSPQNELAKSLGLELDDRSHIIVDRSGRTSLSRVYAAGDITGEPYQISVSVGEGTVAALSAFEDLKVKK